MALLKAHEVAKLTGGSLQGDPEAIGSRLSPLNEAGPGDITYCSRSQFADQLAQCKASIVIAIPGLEAPLAEAVVRSEDPRSAWSLLLRIAHPAPPLRKGISSAAHVDSQACVSEDAFVGAGAVIGGGAQIGARAQIMPGAIIGEDCVIGEETVVHSGAVLYPGAQVGARCILHANCVIGRDGFGFIRTAEGTLERVPQVGRAVLADDVEIGACSCVDRAALTTTNVCQGAKIDNLVQIAHNATVGSHVLIAAMSAMAGSSSIGDRSTMLGRTSVSDNVHIGPEAKLLASANASSDHPGGEALGGSPAVPARQWMRSVAALKSLPTLIRRVQQIESRREDKDRPS